jgi:hypothetical protein
VLVANTAKTSSQTGNSNGQTRERKNKTAYLQKSDNWLQGFIYESILYRIPGTALFQAFSSQPDFAAHFLVGALEIAASSVGCPDSGRKRRKGFHRIIHGQVMKIISPPLLL